jgi:hypothetical protein
MKCVAGKEWNKGQPGDWLRPVSGHPSQALSDDECRYRSGGLPQLLDVMTISFTKYIPLHYQIENHRIDERCCWEKTGDLSWNEIDNWLDTPDSLWNEGCRVPDGGQNGASLYLIEVDRLDILAILNEYKWKTQLKGRFIYKGLSYTLSITDPWLEGVYPTLNGFVDKPKLCISLGDPFNGYSYKLIAGVLFQKRFG